MKLIEFDFPHNLDPEYKTLISINPEYVESIEKIDEKKIRISMISKDSFIIKESFMDFLKKTEFDPAIDYWLANRIFINLKNVVSIKQGSNGTEIQMISGKEIIIPIMNYKRFISIFEKR